MKNKAKNCRCCSKKLTSINRSGTTSNCKSCHNAYQREYFKTYKDKHNEIMKKWRAKNKDKVSMMLKKYLIKVYGSVLEYHKGYQKESIRTMADTYIISQIKKEMLRADGIYIQTSEIPRSLIDLQRNRLALSRKIK
jgi:hypothetical protein